MCYLIVILNLLGEGGTGISSLGGEKGGSALPGVFINYHYRTNHGLPSVIMYGVVAIRTSSNRSKLSIHCWESGWLTPTPPFSRPRLEIVVSPPFDSKATCLDSVGSSVLALPTHPGQRN